MSCSMWGAAQDRSRFIVSMSFRPAIPGRLRSRRACFRFAGRFSCCSETVATVKHHFAGAGEFSTGTMGNFQPELTTGQKRMLRAYTELCWETKKRGEI